MVTSPPLCSNLSRWMCLSSCPPYLFVASCCFRRAQIWFALCDSVCAASEEQAGDDIYFSLQVPTVLWWQSVWNLSEDPGRKTGIPTPSGFLCQVSSLDKASIKLQQECVCVCVCVLLGFINPKCLCLYLSCHSKSLSLLFFTFPCRHCLIQTESLHFSSFFRGTKATWRGTKANE